MCLLNLEHRILEVGDLLSVLNHHVCRWGKVNAWADNSSQLVFSACHLFYLVNAYFTRQKQLFCLAVCPQAGGTHGHRIWWMLKVYMFKKCQINQENEELSGDIQHKGTLVAEEVPEQQNPKSFHTGKTSCDGRENSDSSRPCWAVHWAQHLPACWAPRPLLQCSLSMVFKASAYHRRNPHFVAATEAYEDAVTLISAVWLQCHCLELMHTYMNKREKPQCLPSPNCFWKATAETVTTTLLEVGEAVTIKSQQNTSRCAPAP